jgi:hypothetical protein
MQFKGQELDGSALQQARLQQLIVSQVSSSPLVLQGDALLHAWRLKVKAGV